MPPPSAGSPTRSSSSRTRSRATARRHQPVQSQRAAENFAHGHARIERRIRVLEDHLHAPAQRTDLRLADMRDVLSVEHDTARGRFGQAHHQHAPASTCRSRTCPPGRPSRRGTRRNRRHRPRAGCDAAPGSCRAAAGSAWPARAPPATALSAVATRASVDNAGMQRRRQRAARLRDPAARGTILADRQQIRMLDALRDRERTAGAETAARRPVVRIGWLALDRGQAPVAVIRLGRAAARRAAAPRCRDDAGRPAGPRARLPPPPRRRTSPARASRHWRSRRDRG